MSNSIVTISGPPYLCTSCHYLWDDPEILKRHFRICALNQNDPRLKKYKGRNHERDFYTGHTIPVGRCPIRLSHVSNRAGQPCLRITGNQTRCQYHIKH